MKIVTVQQIQKIEAIANARGLSYQTMMENAGGGCAHWIYKNVPIERGVLALVGSGNNGGDTLIALTELAKRSVRTIAFLVKDRKEDVLIDHYVKSGGQVIDLTQEKNFFYFKAALRQGYVVLDGILGTGIKLPLRETLFHQMAKIKEVIENIPGTIVIAIDCPSGVDCDTGEASEVTIEANDTLTMAAIKKGLLMPPGRSKAGNLHIIDIGIGDPSTFITEELPNVINQNFVHSLLPARSDSGHKGTFGTCLVIAGTPSYTGAAYLTGKAAYLSGAGLVNTGTLEVVRNAIAGKFVEGIWTILPDSNGAYNSDGVDILKKALHQADSLVIGPGLGLAEKTEEFLFRLFEIIPGDLPTLIDADGLNLLTRIDRWWERLPSNTILTPHPGEMSSLTSLSVQEIQANRWQVAQQYARRWDKTVLLKGAVSVIAAPDGKIFVNPVSNSALATAGSGDVLSGIIGGLLGQRLSIVDAAIVGVWLHGKAGEIAQRDYGNDASVTSQDILYRVPLALTLTKEMPIEGIS